MIAIIIPNYNGIEHLKTCYPSLKNQSYKEYKVFLVDNGSTDDSVNYTKQQFPEAENILLKENLGFARAVNEGVKSAIKEEGTKYILLLNNDIELDTDFLKKGVETLEKYSEVSMLATKMLNYYNRNIIDDCGDFIKANGGSPIARGHGEKDIGQYDKEEFIFGACAGAAFYKRKIFEKVGFFDESFFAYYEDIDFSFRAQLLGHKCYYQPKAICYHKRGGTSSIATEGFQAEMCERNLVLMRIKNYPISMYILYQPLFLFARIIRYYTFIRDHSIRVFLRGLRGNMRGLALLVTKIPERYRIQKMKTVDTAHTKSLFIK